MPEKQKKDVTPEADVAPVEEKVLGPGAVLHKVDTNGDLVDESALAEPAATESVTDLGVPDALPTPSPETEPHEDVPA